MLIVQPRRAIAAAALLLLTQTAQAIEPGERVIVLNSGEGGGD